MSEEILEVVDTKQAKVLYFTSSRVIVANIKAGGGLGLAFGALGGLAEARMQAKKKEQLSKVSPESILTADRKNFAIPYADINEVELRKKLMGRREIRLTTGAAKYDFDLGKAKEFEKYLNTLRPIFGDKLIVSSV
jgi:hypothetical protein